MLWQVVDKLDKNTQVLLLDMHNTANPYTDVLQAFSTNHSVVLGNEVLYYSTMAEVLWGLVVSHHTHSWQARARFVSEKQSCHGKVIKLLSLPWFESFIASLS
jgi:ribosomal protein L35AE/L33A